MLVRRLRSGRQSDLLVAGGIAVGSQSGSGSWIVAILLTRDLRLEDAIREEAMGSIDRSVES